MDGSRPSVHVSFTPSKLNIVHQKIHLGCGVEDVPFTCRLRNGLVVCVLTVDAAASLNADVAITPSLKDKQWQK